MRLTRICLLLAGLVLSVASYARSAPGIPAMLIVRLQPAKGQTAYDCPIADYLANEFQADGRVAPIVWGLGDPIYQAAVQDGKIRTSSLTPTLKEAFDAAGKLRADYVLVADLRRNSQGILSEAFLYRRGKLVWKDPDIDAGAAIANLRVGLRNKTLTKEQYDEAVASAPYRVNMPQSGQFGTDDTLKSLARTWTEMIVSGPLVGVIRQPVHPTPNPGKGEAPLTPGNGSTPPAGPVSDAKWSADTEAALKAGDPNKAVSILRGAIDASPMDAARRVKLIQTLMEVGQPEVAAREARRAADLMPDQIQFRALAARAWIQAGNLDEAQNDLNEAVARAPDSPETRFLLANVAIAKGDSATAIDDLNKAIASAPAGDAYYLRALAYAMAGNTDQAVADLKKATDAGLSLDPHQAEERYGLVAAIFDSALQSIGTEITNLQTHAQVQRTDKDVQSAFDDLEKRVQGRVQFLSQLPTPPGHEKSNARRVLAYKLLVECLSDFASYLKSGDLDVLTDSRINLGEALKQGASARQEFLGEQQGATKSNGPSG
ncbi:MAG TPA: tetratricopeptide repeat protein [Fimbriimonadaceae bacterium]|nr:tetratricopeptide repeat protein [Fimbriimonadaceae bacterium]